MYIKTTTKAFYCAKIFVLRVVLAGHFGEFNI